LALKTEAIGLAVMTELPLVVINVQRAGPSTGMPTKTEQADLLMAMYGRHGECPAVVLAASSPSDCFWMAVEAIRLATKYMTPVLLLTDGFLANNSEPLRIPDVESLPDLHIEPPSSPDGFQPFRRDPETLARPWAVPGMAGFEHRVGGLEKEDITGAVCYDADNHRRMIELRAAKIGGIAGDIPAAKVAGEESGRLLVVGWGSTYGAIAGAVAEMQQEGYSVSHLHLRHIHPLPANFEDVLRRFDRVLVVENNTGQLRGILQQQLALDILGYSKTEGRPFLIREIKSKIEELLPSE
jgi:2-oxoglutarate ferredoxin oxidoreductase subunit alpha